ncbi:MAG: tRNA (adenosine(37)-N6)-threonylcarbamoyltransferase complex dimerization subunit type 1 TsaB [Aquificae bacterium]|nr:tRNA (adenosine(37)-N6)-threonylcarbamoyltransferase complex dimerization subunit type 1 TsaB [Aquificota bacterium]
MYLAIDTFSEIFEICIFTENQLLTRVMYSKSRQFSDFIPYKLKQLQEELDFDFDNLSGVIVDKGPGSYTGVRVGVSIAKMIAYSVGIPIYAFVSLDAIAYKYRVYKGYISVVVNAGKGEVYYRDYVSNGFWIEPNSDLKLIPQNKVGTFLSQDRLVILKNVDIDFDNVVHLKESVGFEGGIFSLKNDLIEDIHKLEPIYLRGL